MKKVLIFVMPGGVEVLNYSNLHFSDSLEMPQ